MKKEVRQALEAVARAAGLTVLYGCTYCNQNSHSECDGEQHTMLTFVKTKKDEEDD